jgi:hypothetical protein
MVFTVQRGTEQSQAARERISTTKALKAEIARRALILKADPTNVEKQMALAEVLEEYDTHKGTLAGAVEQVLKSGPAYLGGLPLGAPDPQSAGSEYVYEVLA